MNDDRKSNWVKMSRRRLLPRSLLRGLSLFMIAYLATAYFILPSAWHTFDRYHPVNDDDHRITRTSDGHPGDPINICLIGSKRELKQLMEAAHWYLSDPLSLKADVEIGVDSILKRRYDAAPVSTLLLGGRPEDAAFEQSVDQSPRQRHHVRFWRSSDRDSNGREVWLGAATFDARVGFSHTTGQVTHHIAADIDVERAHLFECLDATQGLEDRYVVPGFHAVTEGRNGGGDPWHTDGELWVGVIQLSQ